MTAAAFDWLGSLSWWWVAVAWVAAWLVIGALLRRHRSARHPLIFPIPVSMKCAHSGSRLVAIGVADARAGNDRAVVEALIVASNRVSAGMTV